MNIRFSFILLCLTICFKLSFSQYCTPWDASTHYCPGEKVTYQNNAYRCKSNDIWSFIPSQYPQYWEHIPMRFCDACTLTVIKPTGIYSIYVKPISSDDTSGGIVWSSFDTADIPYACSTFVRLEARTDPKGIFKRWEYGSTQTTDTAIMLFLTQPRAFRKAVYDLYYTIEL